MKLLTNVKPRTDGTVTVRDSAGKAYVFKPDEQGVLVCDIDDAALCARLLARGGEYEPADEADFDAAERLLQKLAPADKPGDDDGGDDDDDGDFTEMPNGGAPVEANTPPAGDAAAPVEGAAPRAGKKKAGA